MPTETVLVICAILGAFAFFATTLTIADMTWDKVKDRA